MNADFDTFNGSTTKVSFVGRADSFNVSASPALTAAKQDFAAISESVPEAGTPGRFEALRASLAARKATSLELGEKALGIEKSQQIVVDPSIAAAAQQFAGGAKLAMDHVDGHAPAPQGLPVAAKGPKQLS